MNKNKLIQFIAVIILFIFTFGAGIFYGQKQAPLPAAVKQTFNKIINKDAGAPSDLDFSLFWDTWQLIKDKYADTAKIDEQKMFYGAISGMVASLDDPYTIFMDPSETRKFDEELNGVFDGIGAEIGIKKNIIVIVAPLPNSPAEKTGLKAGDKIYKINDTVTLDMSLNEAVSLIRGPKGTTVTLTIIRDNETESREFKIVRKTIVIKSAELKFSNTDKGKIAILKISRFGEDTFSDIKTFAKEILKQNAKGIVLDLRNNPGGFLDSAVDIAGVFLPAGKVVTIERFNKDNKKDYLTEGKNELGNIPLVILANQGSASASEILAGTLRDNRQIKIIGEKTYGKGSVQEVQPLKDNSTLKITIAEWLTPSGKNINKEGISPDIAMELKPEDFEAGKDPQMDAALNELQNL
ncbi:MAG: S41 family peptidase [bacterium]|nr:S41 family peptidase [bacterium]